jgi:hypothetical protein
METFDVGWMLLMRQTGDRDKEFWPTLSEAMKRMVK